MKSLEQSGFYIFAKAACADHTLKEMLQFLRSEAPGKSLQFAYVESETSLIPHLSLWENLHVVVGGSSWREFTESLDLDWKTLLKLIPDPHAKASTVSSWERFTVSLLKATLIKSEHIMIDINEESFSALNLKNFQKILLSISVEKNIYISTANPQTWFDKAHSLIKRENYKFIVEDLRVEKSKEKKSA